MLGSVATRIRSAFMQRAWTWSWWLSLGLHSMILSGLVLYWLNQAELPQSIVQESLQIDGGFSQRSSSEVEDLSIQAPSDPAERSRLLRDIRRQMEQAQQRGDQDNFDRLKQLSADLRRNSTTKTVDEMAEFFGGVVGNRATEPDLKKTDQEFDVSTAQMHDIRKTNDEQGTVRYILVMVDAQGVAREVEIDSENGQRLYKTMQLIKSNPLLEKVYRKILMSILDQVLKDPSQPIEP